MWTLPFTSVAKIFPSARVGDPRPMVPRFVSYRCFPVVASSACRLPELSVTYIRFPSMRGAAKRRGDAVRVPLAARGGDVALEGAIDRDHLAHEAAFERLVALVGVDDAVADGDRRVERAGRETVTPGELAGAGANRVDPAVGAAADHQALVADVAHDGVRLVVEVLDVGRGRRNEPLNLAGAFVERRVTLAQRGMFAPRHAHDADQERIAIDQRRMGAAAVAGAAAHLFTEAGFPHRLARAVEGDELAVAVLGIEIPCLRVARNTGPTHAGVGNGGVVDHETTLPERRAVFGGETGDGFVASLGARGGADPAIENRGRGAAGDGNPEHHVLEGGGVPGGDKAGLTRGAVPVGAAPLGPVRRDTGDGRRSQNDRENGAFESHGHFRLLLWSRYYVATRDPCPRPGR